jgi:hypothetical protein
MWQQKVFTKLLGLQYKILYKQGSYNRVADALFRKSHPESQCSTISTVTPKWIEEVISSYAMDDFTSALVAKLSIDLGAAPNYSLNNGLLRYKNRIWIGANHDLQLKLLHACHYSPLGGHFGIPVTHMRMKKLFAWKGMKKVVHQFVKECITCQQVNQTEPNYQDCYSHCRCPLLLDK